MFSVGGLLGIRKNNEKREEKFEIFPKCGEITQRMEGTMHHMPEMPERLRRCVTRAEETTP